MPPIRFNRGSNEANQRRNHQLLAEHGVLMDYSTPPVDGDVLTYDATRNVFVPMAPAGGGGSGNAYATRVLSIPDLLAYYRMGDLSGTDIDDSSGNGLHGVSSGGPTLGVTGVLPGDPNTAITFDGTDDLISLGMAAALRFTTLTPFTLSLWFRRTASGTGFVSLAGIRDESVAAGSGTAWIVGLNGAEQRPFIRFGTGTAAATTGTFNDNTWRHLALRHNGPPHVNLNVNVFVNGSSVPISATTTPSAITNTTPAKIGAFGNDGTETGFFPGTMDEVAIYNRALTNDEIASLAVPF